jgi:hypothetical protein
VNGRAARGSTESRTRNPRAPDCGFPHRSADIGSRRSTANTARTLPRRRACPSPRCLVHRRRTSSSRLTPRTSQRKSGPRRRRPSAQRSSTRSRTRSRRTWRCWPSRRAGEQQARPRDARRRHPARCRSLPLLRLGDPGGRRRHLRARHGHGRLPLPRAARPAPALAAGNCVVLKPASPTPWSILKFAELIDEIVPPGIINIVNGPGAEIGKALATNKRIAKIAFTGENVIPSTTELTMYGSARASGPAIRAGRSAWAGHQGRPRLDELLPPLPRARGLRRLQGLGRRA